MSVMTYEGPVQWNTAYSVGDVIIYYGQRFYVSSGFSTPMDDPITMAPGINGIRQPSITSSNLVPLSPCGAPPTYNIQSAGADFYAADYGVLGDATTDNWEALQGLLILIRSLTNANSNGYRVILPTGIIYLSRTLILPTQTMLVGQGIYSTFLTLKASADCDVVQPEIYNSSAQATILGNLTGGVAPTQSHLVDALGWGIRDLTIDGNAGAQTLGGYNYGLNASPSGDVDPYGIVENVSFYNCTGDGFYAIGHSALRLTNCLSLGNGGNGYTFAPDTQIDHCQAGYNGVAGFYFCHTGEQGAGNKSYNNGCPTWLPAGQNWQMGNRVIYNGSLYDAKSNLTSDTTVPSSDTTHWAQVSNVTAVNAWGVGVYMDNGSGEITFNCDCQENSADNWYFNECTGHGIHASGVSVLPNFVQGSSPGVPNSTNPNYYSHVTINDGNAVLADIACGDTPGYTSTQYRLRMINQTPRALATSG